MQILPAAFIAFGLVAIAATFPVAGLVIFAALYPIWRTS